MRKSTNYKGKLMQRPGKKRITFYLDKDEYEVVAKLGIKYDITLTELFRRYARYLMTKDYRSRKALDENTDSDFMPDKPIP